MTEPVFFSTQISGARRFYRDLSIPPEGSLAVVCGGLEECAPDYEIRRRDFPYWSVEFVARGKGTLVLAGKRCGLRPGVLFAYGPRIAHDILTVASEPLVKYFVDFSGRAAERLLRRLAPPPGGVVQTSAPSEVLSVFDDLIREGLRDTPFSDRLSARLLEVLLLKVAETSVPPGSIESTAFATYERCRRLLEEHALELRTLTALAELCGVDPAYLCRLFKRFDHESPYRRLMRLRMNSAAARLQVPGTLVRRVAEDLGFSDPYHFSRAFKGVFGLAPERFVQAHRGGRGARVGIPEETGKRGPKPHRVCGGR